MHDAIPSRILNGWLRLEEDLFHLQVLSYLPPQIPIYRSSTHPDYTIKRETRKARIFFDWQSAKRRRVHAVPTRRLEVRSFVSKGD